jgi:HTH-type transcriptional regulator, sugar sensing transcriptional regulator
MISDIFESFGLKEEEAKIWLALLDFGPRRAGDLAKLMSQPRPTVYGYLERLMAAGLVTQSVSGGIKLFVPEPPEKIRLLYKRKIEELRTREKSLDGMIRALDKRSGLNLLRPRMHFFEGREGIESALEDMLKMPAGSVTLSFWPIRAALEVTSVEFFRYHNTERIRRDIYTKGIWPRAQAIDIRKHPYLGWGEEFKRELRYAPEDVDATMGYWIYGNKVIFISSRAESYGFIMESAELAQMMSVQHRLVWNISEPIPFDKKYVQGFIEDLKSD